MRDIGNGDDKSPAAVRLWLGIHRIVEVARIRTVDGHKRQRGEIPASDRVTGRHAAGRVDVECIGPVDGHAVARKQGGSRTVGFVSCAQHGQDAAAVPAPVLPQQRHFDDIAVAGAPVVVLDLDASLDRRVQGLDEASLIPLHDVSDERFGGRLDHAQTPVPARAPARLAASRELDAVAGSDIRSARQLVPGAFDHQLAVGFHDLHHFRCVVQHILAVRQPGDLAQVFESAQQAPQSMRPGTLAEAEMPDQVLPLGRVQRLQGVADIAREKLRLRQVLPTSTTSQN